MCIYLVTQIAACLKMGGDIACVCQAATQTTWGVLSLKTLNVQDTWIKQSEGHKSTGNAELPDNWVFKIYFDE